MHRAPEYVLSHFGDMDSLGRCCKSRRCNRCLELEDQTVSDSLAANCGTECCKEQQLYRQDLAYAMTSDAEAQGKLLAIISERLDETVQLNEACKVKEITPTSICPIVQYTGTVLACRHTHCPAFTQLPARLACFEGPRPLLSPADYVRRIAKYSRTSDCCFLVGLVYLDRLKHCEPALRLTPTSLQRLLLVAVMLATKFLEDRGPRNNWWCAQPPLPSPHTCLPCHSHELSGKGNRRPPTHRGVLAHTIPPPSPSRQYQPPYCSCSCSKSPQRNGTGQCRGCRQWHSAAID
jgi:hypothetical protein